MGLAPHITNTKENSVGTTEIKTSSSPGCLTQLLWFIFIGWWAGQIAVGLAFFCMATIILIPLGIALLNALPAIVALRQRPETVTLNTTDDGVTIVRGHGQQIFWPLRVIWFFVIGLWLTGLWIEVAYILCVTIIGLPLAFWMFDKVPVVLTLRRD
jgi:uncharacterized membrane protein YccF (DUF307 family)